MRASQSEEPPRRTLASFASEHSIRNQYKTWESRAESWDRENSSAVQPVADALLDMLDVGPGARVIDLGCGTGRLALPIAQLGAEVLAVDVSPAMIDELAQQARTLGLTSVQTMVAPLERLSLSPDDYDLIVSNYALHHLRNDDKTRLVAATYRWLRPGGRLVIADMMFGRGATRGDRQIIASKVRTMARKGLPGYWRILKNSFRFMFRVQERPLPQDEWRRLLATAGFVDVESQAVRAEAGIVAGRKPQP
ncbi:MAG TPA: methyltransferase domain-containing protein [Acidimicrobiales bacterium]|nr:methyltransferase domain-containing protein [Acidimicrobiales bacterium]